MVDSYDSLYFCIVTYFSLLILLIGILSFFFLMSLSNHLLILFNFPSSQLLVLLIFATVYFVSFSVISALIFMTTFLLLTFKIFVVFLIALGISLGHLFYASLVS